jgi:hypothetical protein
MGHLEHLLPWRGTVMLTSTTGDATSGFSSSTDVGDRVCDAILYDAGRFAY